MTAHIDIHTPWRKSSFSDPDAYRALVGFAQQLDLP
jgi:hypothetical protein